MSTTVVDATAQQPGTKVEYEEPSQAAQSGCCDQPSNSCDQPSDSEPPKRVCVMSAFGAGAGGIVGYAFAAACTIL
jgi:hypothetical protein